MRLLDTLFKHARLFQTLWPDRSVKIQNLSQRYGHCFRIAFNVVGREADDGPAFSFQELLSLSVALFRLFVIATVDFDNEFCFGAGEVGNERTDRMLPTKF